MKRFGSGKVDGVLGGTRESLRPLSSGRFILANVRVEDRLNVWDSSTLGAQWRQAPVRYLCGVSWSHDGTRRLDFGWGDLTLRRDDDGMPIWKRSLSRTYVDTAAFCPDGKRAALLDRRGQLVVFDLEEGRSLHRVSSGIGEHGVLAWHPDGKRVYAGGPLGLVVFDPADESLRRLEPGLETVRSLLACNDELIVGGRPDASEMGHLVAIDMQRETIRRRGHPDFVTRSLALSPDGNTLALGGMNGEMALCRAATFDQLRRLGKQEAEIRQIAFVDDDERIATISLRGLCLYDPTEGDIVFSRRSRGINLRFDADQRSIRYLQVGSAESKGVELVVLETRPGRNWSSRLQQRVLGLRQVKLEEVTADARAAIIRTSPDLSKAMRETWLDINRRLGDCPNQMSSKAWGALKSPNRDAADRKKGLRYATLAAGLLPTDLGIRETLALGYYRNEEFAEALAELDRLAVDARMLGSDVDAGAWALRSMVLFRLRRSVEARESLLRAHDRSAKSTRFKRDLGDRLAEADALLKDPID